MTNTCPKQRGNRTPGLSDTQTRPPERPQNASSTASELFYLKGIRAVGVERLARKPIRTKMILLSELPSPMTKLWLKWLREADANFGNPWDADGRGRHPRIPKADQGLPSLCWPGTCRSQGPRLPDGERGRVETHEKITPLEKLIEAHKRKLPPGSPRCVPNGSPPQSDCLADHLFPPECKGPGHYSDSGVARARLRTSPRAAKMVDRIATLRAS